MRSSGDDGQAACVWPWFLLSILYEVKPPTGEPYAGEPHVRFGRRGARATGLPYRYPSFSGPAAGAAEHCLCDPAPSPPPGGTGPPPLRRRSIGSATRPGSAPQAAADRAADGLAKEPAPKERPDRRRAGDGAVVARPGPGSAPNPTAVQKRRRKASPSKRRRPALRRAHQGVAPRHAPLRPLARSGPSPPPGGTGPPPLRRRSTGSATRRGSAPTPTAVQKRRRKASPSKRRRPGLRRAHQGVAPRHPPLRPLARSGPGRAAWLRRSCSVPATDGSQRGAGRLRAIGVDHLRLR